MNRAYKFFKLTMGQHMKLEFRKKVKKKYCLLNAVIFFLDSLATPVVSNENSDRTTLRIFKTNMAQNHQRLSYLKECEKCRFFLFL